MLVFLFTLLGLLLTPPAHGQTCGICTFKFGCTDQFGCNYDSTADAPAPDNALCDYGDDINRDRVCDDFQTFADIVCIDSETELADATGAPIKAADVRVGHVLKTATGSTTVRNVQMYNQTHHPLRIDAGACGKHDAVIVTEDHAVWCRDRWVRASDVGVHADRPGTFQYVAIHTDDYCDDRLVTTTGLELEGWDGRLKSSWRPHRYEDGRRVRCAQKDSAWEYLLWTVDYAIEHL